VLPITPQVNHSCLFSERRRKNSKIFFTGMVVPEKYGLF